MVRTVNAGRRKKSETLPFSRRNYQIFFMGLGVIIAGYFVMATGSTYSFRSLTIAPLMLIVGYCVIVPLAILYRRREEGNKDKPPEA